MSLKAQRIASDIQKEINLIIIKESRNEVLKAITITGCEVTTDFSKAKIYYTYLGDNSKEIIDAELERCTSFLRKNLAQRIDMRHIPEINFIYDNSVEYGMKSETLLKEIKDNE